jgi:hypothetical protein
MMQTQRLVALLGACALLWALETRWPLLLSAATELGTCFPTSFWRH